MGSESELLWGVLFGSVGLGFFLYGKKQRMIVPIVCGLALMVYPYFMPNAFALVLTGLVLVAIPYFFRL
jgi:multisubunit Na+/H+ antiporter MnhC subunit